MEPGEFSAKWYGKKGGAERANFHQFVNDFCHALALPVPDAAEGGVLGEYQFEGPVPGGSFRSLKASGFIDLYKQGCFILEAKQSYLRDGQAEPARIEGSGYDRLMRDAYAQARNYAAYLPAERPMVPFLIVADIGRAFEVYFDYAGNGRGFDPFPDPQSYRITLDQLDDPKFVKRLRAIWTDPASIDPRRLSADVSRRVALQLADVSSALERRVRDHPEQVQEASLFLMRILFCMFAEDVGLLPKDKFKGFLESSLDDDALFKRGLADLWQNMGQHHRSDRWSYAVSDTVRYFNGGLFKRADVFTLIKSDRELLLQAAKANWANVEPAIFGTLLEAALKGERDKLGAHYTPRPYVERLVRATFIDELEAEWAGIEEAARSQSAEEALSQAAAFHGKLANLKILDPACGTGNFLYVSMELLLRLELRLVMLIHDLDGSEPLRIGPHQFFGLELNTRAAKITEMVLWIGWLRNRIANDSGAIPDPVLETLATINLGKLDCFDSVVRHTLISAPESDRFLLGEPDSVDPGPPDWPEADYIVGNPPFSGGKDLRSDLGDAYAEALWRANPDVGRSADLVMHFWNRAADILTRPGTRLKRFGFVTTNSITQEFSRRVIAARLEALSVVMAIPDHP